MVSKSYRFTMAALMGLMVTGCYDGRDPEGDGGDTDDGTEAGGETEGGPGGETEGGPGGGTEGTASGTDGETDDPTNGETNSGSGPGDPPPDCLPGAAGCECLNGGCQGLSNCEDDVCVPGPPIPEVDGDTTAIAGLSIRLNGDIDDDPSIAGFDQLQWTRVDGPNTIIEHEVGLNAVAHLPQGASAGDEFTFRLSANLGDATTSSDYTVTIVDADATGPMDESPETIAFGGAIVAPRGDDDYWIASSLGMFAGINDSVLGESYDLGSPISDIISYADNRVLVAQPDIQTVTEFNSNNNASAPFLTEVSGGGPLGGASVLAVDGDANVYIGTTEGTVLFYNSPDGGQTATTTLLETLSAVPTAFALGDVQVAPEDDNGDEGTILYIGTAGGDVVQIGLSAAEIPSDVEIGSESAYISIPGTGPVTGLTLDDVGNMWVGKSSGLYLVRRAFETAPEVVRTISPAAGLGEFHGLRVVDDSRLEWIDSSTGRVGRLYTGP